MLHPVVFSVKRFMRQFNKEREVVMFVDLHGHSRRKNIFMYGNNIKERPHATRVFPYILSKLCDFFSFESSRFSMSKYKESTARITMFKELNIPNIFTMEASFCGADKGQLAGNHFSSDHFMLAGRKLMESLLVYYKIDLGSHQPQGEEKEKPEFLKFNAVELEKELTQNKELIKMTAGREDDSSGSES